MGLLQEWIDKEQFLTKLVLDTLDQTLTDPTPIQNNKNLVFDTRCISSYENICSFLEKEGLLINISNRTYSSGGTILGEFKLTEKGIKLFEKGYCSEFFEKFTTKFDKKEVGKH